MASRAVTGTTHRHRRILPGTGGSGGASGAGGVGGRCDRRRVGQLTGDSPSTTVAVCAAPAASVQPTLIRSPGSCWASTLSSASRLVTVVPSSEVIVAPADTPASAAGASEGAAATGTPEPAPSWVVAATETPRYADGPTWTPPVSWPASISRTTVSASAIGIA